MCHRNSFTLYNIYVVVEWRNKKTSQLEGKKNEPIYYTYNIVTIRLTCLIIIIMWVISNGYFRISGWCVIVSWLTSSLKQNEWTIKFVYNFFCSSLKNSIGNIVYYYCWPNNNQWWKKCASKLNSSNNEKKSVAAMVLPRDAIHVIMPNNLYLFCHFFCLFARMTGRERFANNNRIINWREKKIHTKKEKLNKK